MKAKCVCNIHNVVMFSIDTTVIRLNSISTLIMTPKMNNNNRKNLSKTIAMAGMGFLLIAAAFTFSFANSGGGGNQTSGGGGNQTSGGGGNQTSGGGGNQTSGGGGGGQESPYILGGNWNLNVEGGNVTDFTANIMMVHTDGSGYHTHNITNFNVGNTTVQLIQGQETSISGSADIYTNGTIKWPGSDTTLTLTPNGTVMTIMPAAEDTDNHFQGQPIYGIASQITGENGTMIAQTTPPGQQQQEEGGGGPLSGLFGGQQQGGNQSGGGGPLSGLTEPFQDLFGGGNR
jgi:hypothetical protein